MSAQESLQKLIETIGKDPQKIQEFSSKKTKEELYKYCVSVVPGYSAEEFDKFMATLGKSSIVTKQRQQISDEKLAQVSGGAEGQTILDKAHQTGLSIKMFLELGEKLGRQLALIYYDITEDEYNKL